MPSNVPSNGMAIPIPRPDFVGNDVMYNNPMYTPLPMANFVMPVNETPQGMTETTGTFLPGTYTLNPLPTAASTPMLRRR